MATWLRHVEHAIWPCTIRPSTCNSWPQTVAYAAIGVYGVTGAVLGARRNLDARGRRPWYLFALGLAGFVAGDAIFDVYSLGNRALPFTSAADWIYLAAYPVLFLGIALLIGRLGRAVGEAHPVGDAGFC